MMKKQFASVRIAIGFVLICLLCYYGYSLWANYRISNMKFATIKPGRINIVGVDLGKGFKIVVANQVAQLRQRSEKEQKGPLQENYEDTNDDSGSKRNRIPIRDMLGAMQGDEEKLSRFVMTLNDIRDDKLPPERVYWKADDLKKALGGDAALKAKLVSDLNIELDGTPLPELRTKSLEDGIVILLPVPIRVRVGAEQKTLTATVMRPYRPNLMKHIEQLYEDKAEATKRTEIAYYIQESQKTIQDPKTKENVAKSIEAILDPSSAEEYAQGPESVLQAATIVVNDSMIRSASEKTYDTAQGRFSDLTLNLRGEGPDRLWAYTRGKVGTQLLLIADGIAIAAPRITHELAQSELVITQMKDKVLLDQAIQAINAHGGAK